MKKKALIAAVLAATTLTATTAFAAQNPFKDLPEGHWAYDAVTMLAQDGVIDGYGDGNFKGDKLMNRYEMAEIVSKAVAKYDGLRPQDKGAVKKLEQEFGAELKDMDVRLKGVEEDVKQLKKGQSSFKWFGDARMRHFKNKAGSAVSGVKSVGTDNDYNNSKTENQNEMRVRLGFYGEPAANLSVTGQLKAENANIARSDYVTTDNHYAGKNDEKMSFNRLQLDWHAKNQVTVSAGRDELSLGQGLIYWENPVDGVMVKKDFGDKASLMIGAGDTSCATWDSNAGYATFANLKAKVSPAIEVTASYFNQSSDAQSKYAYPLYETWNNGGTWWKKDDDKLTTKRDFSQIALGVKAQLSPKWSAIVEGVRNNATVKRTLSLSDSGTSNIDVSNLANQKNGFWGRLIYGKQDWNKANTWQVYGEYFALGNVAIDSSGWAHRLNIAGGNGYGGDGARGWGLGASYMLAANTNLELTYYKLKPYDTNASNFDSYNDIAYAALSYSF